MPRKKKAESNEGTVLLGYIHNFTYNDPDDQKAMGGHPANGRVYRIIKDGEGAYRLYVGEENNPMQSAGIFIDTLSGEYPRWSYEIEIINEDNYSKLDIHEDDIEAIDEWFKSSNMALDGYINPERVIIGDKKPAPPELQPLTPEELMMILRQAHDESDPDEISMSNDVLKLAMDLDNIQQKDPELFQCLEYLIEFLLANLKDKYEGSSLPNISKQLLMNDELGKGANIFTVVKYLQRYATTGFSKSENPIDLLKAIHYILFEVQRTKPWNKPTKIKVYGKK